MFRVISLFMQFNIKPKYEKLNNVCVRVLLYQQKRKNVGLFFLIFKSQNLYHPMSKTLDISNYEFCYRLNNISLKYQWLTTSDCRDIGILKFEFAALMVSLRIFSLFIFKQ